MYKKMLLFIYFNAYALELHLQPIKKADFKPFETHITMTNNVQQNHKRVVLLRDVRIKKKRIEYTLSLRY